MLSFVVCGTVCRKLSICTAFPQSDTRGAFSTGPTVEPIYYSGRKDMVPVHHGLLNAPKTSRIFKS